MFLLKGRYSLAILIALAMIFLMAGCGSDSSESSKPQVEKNQSAEKPKSAPQPLGEHWIKDSNDVYLWNPQPQKGETVTWSGDFVQDGDYKFAEGSGTVTWYLNGEFEQLDAGTFKHGQRNGHFKHEFPSGRVDYSNWDNGVEIPNDDSGASELDVAKQTFINYHKAITDGNYRAAYDTLSYAQRERVGDFNSYVAGFENTLSSEVTDITLVSSDGDSYTFDYTLTARDRHTGNDVKIQVFKGQVTMAKDNGRWYVRYARSERVDAKIIAEAETEQKARLETEQKVREENLAKTSAEKDLAKVTTFAKDTSTKDYLEDLQPFALANLTKKVTGIIGLFEDGNNKSLEKYVMAMTLLADRERSRNTAISRDVALYFEYEAKLAAVYAAMDNMSILQKAASLAIVYDLSDKEEAVEKRIRETAEACGADLSNYAETEAIRRILEVVKNL